MSTEQTQFALEAVYPYATHLDIRYPALEFVDIQRSRRRHDRWYNQTLCRVTIQSFDRRHAGSIMAQARRSRRVLYVVEGTVLIDPRTNGGATPRQGLWCPEEPWHRPTRAEEGDHPNGRGRGVCANGRLD